MSKVAATTSISPNALSLGAPVLASPTRAALEMLNWSFSNRPQTHFSWCSGGDQMSTNAPEICGPISFGFDLSPEERLRGRAKILAETQELLVGIRCKMVATTTVDVTVTVGGDSHTFSLVAADDGDELTHVFATADTGTGWQTVTVVLEGTFGPFQNCYLLNVRLQDQPIAEADLPDPL